VHLRGDSISARAARSLLPAGAVVGRSVHGVKETSDVARGGGLDYLIFGTLFESPSKGTNHRFATLDELSAACRAAAAAGASEPPGPEAGAAGIPVLAIGGMTLERAALVRRAGASGIAGIGLFIPPAGEDVGGYLQAVVSHLRRTFDTVQAVT
jgi:thiamine-phosphate pyrophosphorylase